MIARSISQKTQWVTLANGPTDPDDADGYWEPLNPEGVWAAIAPFTPTAGERTVQSQVTIDFHPDVGLDTRIVFVDRAGRERHLFVRGLQNPNYENVELVLTCDEAI